MKEILASMSPCKAFRQAFSDYCHVHHGWTSFSVVAWLHFKSHYRGDQCHFTYTFDCLVHSNLGWMDFSSSFPTFQCCIKLTARVLSTYIYIYDLIVTHLCSLIIFILSFTLMQMDKIASLLRLIFLM